MEKYLSILRACPLFAEAQESELTAMLACLGAQPRRYEKGETILREREPARCLGVVLHGAVQIMLIDYDGSRSITAKLGPSDLFAESFACAGVPAMPVDVIAAENSDVLLIDARRILHTCNHACSFHYRMICSLMHILAAKNLAFHQKMEIIAQRTTRAKLTTYLLQEARKAKSASFTIPFDRQELADYLGVDRSGLSAEIGKLRREGVLLCTRSHFTLMSSVFPKEELS